MPKYSTYTRRTMPGGDGIKMVETTSSGITKVSNLFPVVLYLVAALVTVTTMTRFVQEERNNAGILKALGYNDTDVIKKFVLYGLISGDWVRFWERYLERTYFRIFYAHHSWQT